MMTSWYGQAWLISGPFWRMLNKQWNCLRFEAPGSLCDVIVTRWNRNCLKGETNAIFACRKDIEDTVPVLRTYFGGDRWMEVSTVINFMMTSSNGNIFRVTGPLCGEFTSPGEFPTQRPVMRGVDVFFDPHLNKRLSKQPWGWWFETLSWSLWRQCNVNTAFGLQTLKSSEVVFALRWWLYSLITWDQMPCQEVVDRKWYWTTHDILSLFSGSSTRTAL